MLVNGEEKHENPALCFPLHSKRLKADVPHGVAIQKHRA